MILGNRTRGGRRGLLGRLRGLGVTSTLVNGSLVYSDPISRPIGPAGGIHKVPTTPTPPIRITGPIKTVAPTNPNAVPAGDTNSLATLWQYYNGGTQLSAYQLNRLQAAGYPVGASSSGGWTGGGGYGGGYGYGGGGNYQNPNLPSSQNNLAQTTQLYYQNPNSLTAQQWSQLQAAGVIPSTVPYGDASLVNPLASSANASTATDSGIDPSTGVPYATELAEAEAAGSSGSIGTTLSADYGGIPLYGWLAGGVVLYLLMSKKR